MMPQGPNLSPRPSLPPTRRYAVDPNLPQRRRPVTTAMADTGLLYALAHRPPYLDMFLDLYGESVAVAQAVELEIRKVAQVQMGRRAERGLVLMGACADRLVVKLDQGIIPVRELPQDGGEMLATVLQQLGDYDRAAAERRGDPWYAQDLTRSARHAGEAESIVIAADVRKDSGTSLLLTNDGGASLTAWRQGVSARNLRDLLAELACENTALKEDDLLQAFNEMTAHFATPPAEVCPADSGAFRCHAFGGQCNRCDRGAR